MYKFMNKWRNLYGKCKNTDNSATGPSLAVCAQLNDKGSKYHAISIM